jgi:hypothetical protein
VLAIHDFSLNPLGTGSSQSDLRWRAHPVGVRVDGIPLEAQWRVGSGYLLFLTDDSPFEEGLHIYLLDDGKRVVEGLEVAAPYAPGILTDAATEGDAAVCFSFVGGDRWRLAVNTTPRRTLPRLFSLVKWKSGFMRKRRLSLQRLR